MCSDVLLLSDPYNIRYSVRLPLRFKRPHHGISLVLKRK